MYILGISCYYHDASAALIKDGKIVAAAEEERFTRIKHDSGFPINAVKFCLNSQGISINDIGYIGFYEKPLVKLERVLYQHLEMFPLSLKTFVTSMPSWLTEKLRVIRKVRKALKYKGDVLFIEHHMAHAASAFLPSPFKKAAIVTVDGVGEWTTTAYGIGNKNSINLLKEIRFPHSLGLLYSTITAYLGFKVNNSEYKVMGLSAYGNQDKETNEFYQKIKQVIDLKEDGSFRLNMGYFTYHYKDRMPSKRLCRLLGGKIRKRSEPITKRHKDIAAALQIVYEEALFRILNHIQRQTKQKNIVLAGGCGLNSVANGKILKNTKFKNIWIQPASSDSGTSIGAALYIYNTILNKERKEPMDSAYLGPEFSKQEIKEFLEKNRIKYREFKSQEDLIKTTSNLIFKNKVIGWFQGRMEFGPRALGSRSILANPCNPKARELLNKKVKHRESFRPFAPVVCEEDAEKYFECDKPLPKPADFMLMVYPIKKEYQKKLPSVTHIDGTGRLQVIRKKQNELYYKLIKRFGHVSGIPILINTSFNIRGESIVCTPNDAYKCMMGTEIDCLIIGNFLVKREDNKRDKWDSESYATD